MRVECGPLSDPGDERMSVRVGPEYVVQLFESGGLPFGRSAGGLAEDQQDRIVEDL
jgi:hypothetical protein